MTSMPLKEWIERYGQFSLPLRLLLTAALSAVGSSGLGIVAEYASYRYAYHHNFRPPFEGVPFLRVAVTTTSLVALLGAAVLFAVVYYLTRYLLREIDRLLSHTRRYTHWIARLVGSKTKPELGVEFLVRLPVQVVIPTALMVGLIAFLASQLAFRQLLAFGPFEFNPAPVYGILAALSVLLLWRRTLVYWLAAMAAAVAILATPALLEPAPIP